MLTDQIAARMRELYDLHARLYQLHNPRAILPKAETLSREMDAQLFYEFRMKFLADGDKKGTDLRDLSAEETALFTDAMSTAHACPPNKQFRNNWTVVDRGGKYAAIPLQRGIRDNLRMSHIMSSFMPGMETTFHGVHYSQGRHVSHLPPPEICIKPQGAVEFLVPLSK